MFYAGYEDMWRRVLDMAKRMPDVDAIAGVPVSGLAPAGMLSAATGIKCVPIEAIPEEIKTLLVLEDASGFAKMKLQRLGQGNDRYVLYGAVYACDAAVSLDLVGCIAPKPRIFTWNILKSNRCDRIAYDLDGVLCEDPQKEQIDYGARYDAFLQNTKPTRYVKSKLGWIVTGRMERYRKQTEAWLAANGIQYGQLVMAPDTQAHTTEAHAKHKADWLAANPDCILFVESNHKQAECIAKLSGRAVVCLTTETGWNTTKATELNTPHVKKHDRIIYTISTGKYSDFAPHSYIPPEGWDYRVITDKDCPAYLSDKQKAAWAKINAPRLFSEYEASLCIDDDMTVLKDPTPMTDTHEWLIHFRKAVSTWKRDLELVRDKRCAASADAVESELNRHIAAGFVDSRNWLSNLIYRRHTDHVKRVCDEWWQRYTLSETQRDQPSFAIACQALGWQPDEILECDSTQYVLHDTRKADRDGVRKYVNNRPALNTENPSHAKLATQKRKPRRRGDRT